MPERTLVRNAEAGIKTQPEEMWFHMLTVSMESCYPGGRAESWRRASVCSAIAMQSSCLSPSQERRGQRFGQRGADAQ